MDIRKYLEMGVSLPLGISGENGIESGEFGYGDWASLYGEGVLSINHQRPGDSSPYPVGLTTSGHIAHWDVTAADVQYSGHGRIQVVYAVNGVMKKSMTGTTVIEPSLGENVGADPAIQSYIDTMVEIKDEAYQSMVTAVNAKDVAVQKAADILDLTADASINNAVGTPTVSVSVSQDGDHKNMSFSFQNLKGEPGEITEEELAEAINGVKTSAWITEDNFTETTVPKVVKDYVTPEMYGAKGDNTADDTEAIQDAINSGLPVYIPNKRYKTTSKIEIPNTCPTIHSEGIVAYTGNDYAFELVSCVGKKYQFGRIYASNGGCLKMDSSRGWQQYLDIYFREFRASTNCVYIYIPTSWINEIRFFEGEFAQGAYGVYADNTTSVFKGHYIFSEIGFEGVTTGIYLSQKFSNIACYGCRMEETTVNLVETNMTTVDSGNSFFWYGRLYASFLTKAKKLPIYIYGTYYNTDGSAIASQGLVMDQCFYGDIKNRQYYDGSSWASSNYEKTLTNSMLQLYGNYIRYPDVDDGQSCVVNIDMDAIMTTAVVTNTIMLNLTVMAGGTLTIQTSSGTTIKTYAPSSSFWGKKLKISYIANWGLVLEEPSQTYVLGV